MDAIFTFLRLFPSVLNMSSEMSTVYRSVCFTNNCANLVIWRIDYHGI